MRLIDADFVKQKMNQTMDYQDLYLPIHFEQVLDDAPTISPDEVRGVGKWITDRTWEHDGEPYCSVCDFEQSFARFQKFKFCPNCGAKMEIGGAL